MNTANDRAGLETSGRTFRFGISSCEISILESGGERKKVLVVKAEILNRSGFPAEFRLQVFVKQRYK